MRMFVNPVAVPVDGAGAPGPLSFPLTHQERLDYIRVMRREGKTYGEIGRRIGRSRQWVRNQEFYAGRRLNTFFRLAEEFRAPVEVLDEAWLIAVIE